MSGREAALEPASDSPHRVLEDFERRYARRPEIVVRAPGRVNLLGAHVDYSEGLVMPAAVDRAVWLAAAPASGRWLRLAAGDLGEEARLDLADLPPPPDERRPPEARWSDVPAGIAWALARAGRPPAALDVVYAGDLPIGKGLSSSAAVGVAFLLAWEGLGPAAELEGDERARLVQEAENGYLGVGAGVMDPYASLHGKRGHVMLLDCRDLGCEQLPLGDGAAVLIADPGTPRRLAASGFNDRRRQCEKALALLRRHLPALRSLRDLTEDDYELQSHRLPPELRRRVRHAVEERRRVRAGAAALRRGDLTAFGRLMRRSQLSSRDLYEVSTPELDALAAAAWSAPGCHGARLAGGGFGGCLIALVDADRADDVAATLRQAGRRDLGREPETFLYRTADGADVVEV